MGDADAHADIEAAWADMGRAIVDNQSPLDGPSSLPSLSHGKYLLEARFSYLKFRAHKVLAEHLSAEEDRLLGDHIRLNRQATLSHLSIMCGLDQSWHCAMKASKPSSREGQVGVWMGYSMVSDMTQFLQKTLHHIRSLLIDLPFISCPRAAKVVDASPKRFPFASLADPNFTSNVSRELSRAITVVRSPNRKLSCPNPGPSFLRTGVLHNVVK